MKTKNNYVACSICNVKEEGAFYQGHKICNKCLSKIKSDSAFITAKCKICGNTEDVLHFDGYYVCKDCILIAKRLLISKTSKCLMCDGDYSLMELNEMRICPSCTKAINDFLENNPDIKTLDAFSEKQTKKS